MDGVELTREDICKMQWQQTEEAHVLYHGNKVEDENVQSRRMAIDVHEVHRFDGGPVGAARKEKRVRMRMVARKRKRRKREGIITSS